MQDQSRPAPYSDGIRGSYYYLYDDFRAWRNQYEALVERHQWTEAVARQFTPRVLATWCASKPGEGNLPRIALPPDTRDTRRRTTTRRRMFPLPGQEDPNLPDQRNSVRRSEDPTMEPGGEQDFQLGQ